MAKAENAGQGSPWQWFRCRHCGKVLTVAILNGKMLLKCKACNKVTEFNNTG